MGQKTHPIGFRLGVIRTWNSRWFAPNNKVADLIQEDILVKRYINRRLENAGIARIQISRAPKKVSVDIHTSRPGIVIGRKGAEVDKLRDELRLLTNKEIVLNIVEVRKPELDAALVADSIARQLEGRVAFRRALKKSLAATMKMGAMGVKVQCGGRLGGAEIARTEKYRSGRVPLHTLRADIDYATATAHTTYGCIGVKVWICRGEVLGKGHFVGEPDRPLETDKQQAQAGQQQQHQRGDRDRGPDRGGDRRPNRGGPGGGPGGPGGGSGGHRPKGRVRKPGESEEAPRGRRPDAGRPEAGRPEANRSAPARPDAAKGKDQGGRPHHKPEEKGKLRPRGGETASGENKAKE